MGILEKKTGDLYSCVMSIAVVVLLMIISPTQAHSSACCAEPGTWNKPVTVPKENLKTLIDSLKFPERVYANCPGAETAGFCVNRPDTQEENNLFSDHYKISISLSDQHWRFDFRENNKTVGSLILSIPEKGTSISMDTNLEQKKESCVTLYKELQIESDVKGTGIFASDMITGVSYRLIIQGEGTYCDDHFKRFILQIEGPENNNTEERQLYYYFYGFFGNKTN
ncbi:hypothetical protein [Sulfurovum sp.]|jgi:hypothetical protein|uniref:hypothetical protein n=1 Tax=Sulfurovum sp. TaxID=1969726 RepID=UPI002A35F375|nr:hypothetical protein [Sulfurovum sp.]MDD2452001.1 hypothetical protein [Sulfurovum sp.]MDY0403493.1 hypothetical protein [Sulfurovum sp.]